MIGLDTYICWIVGYMFDDRSYLINRMIKEEAETRRQNPQPFLTSDKNEGSKVTITF